VEQRAPQVKQNDPERVLSGSIPSHYKSVPSLHDLGEGLSYWLFAMLVAYMLQHCTGGLRSRATQSVSELVDAHGVRAHIAGESHTARVSADRIHHAEHTPALFRPPSK
jgi:hypothetical protein